MVRRLRHARQRLRDAWLPIQVEYQGSYSTERLRRLGSYMETLTTRRVILVAVLTPLPCIVLSLLKEVPPLVPAEAGVYANRVFFARGWVILCFMAVSALVQMGHGAPRLKLTNFQIAWVSLLTATVSILFIFGICALTVFPLPFGLLVAGPPFVLVIAICFTSISGPQWRADPTILVDVKRQLVVYNCQTTLPFVYPLYIYGFVSLTGWNQVVFVSVLPVIQIFAKNWISRALVDDNDQKPQCVIFVVEVYNALYVSNVLQTATSWTSTAAIMFVDLLQFCVSMFDIVKILNEVKSLIGKIPRDHPRAKDNFVQIAVSLLNIEQHDNQSKNIVGGSNKEKNSMTCTREAHETTKLNEKRSHKWMKLQKARVSPFPAPTELDLGSVTPIPTENPQISARPDSLELIFNHEERVHFIHRSSHLLFIIEYLVLIEYVEVVLPAAYCLHQLILFHMPNSAYYPTLAGLSREEFMSRMFSTLLYSLFEFASFIMLIIVLKHKLGYSSLQQLAFVLDVQAGVVQTKLNLIFVYIMQVSLAHHGADFSFKFAWLKHDSKV